MIKIDGYESYFFNPKDCEIYSVRISGTKKLSPITSRRGYKLSYALYSNGVKDVLSKFEIMKIVINRLTQ